MDISHYYGLIFDLDNKNKAPGKYLLKLVKFQNLVEKCCNVWKIYCSLKKFANILIIVLRAEIATIFEPKVVTISARKQ